MAALRITILLITISFFNESSSAQEWINEYGGAGIDKAYGISECENGELVFTGWTTSYGDPKGDVLLTKTDKFGRELWTKTFGGDEDDGGTDLIVTSDGGFLIIGHTASFGYGLCDFYVIKTDRDGNLEWQTTLGDLSDDVGNAVVETSDGGFVLVGSIEIALHNHHHSPDPTFLSAHTQLAAIKMNSDGKVLWTKTYGGSDGESGRGIIEMSNGDLAIVGVTGSFGQGQDAYLVRLNSDGQMVWESALGTSNDERAYDLVETAEGGIIISGNSRDVLANDFDIFYAKVDGDGNQLWQKKIDKGEVDASYGIAKCSDGNYILSTTMTSGSDPDLSSIKIDGDGEIIWKSYYSGPGVEYAYGITPCQDGTFLLIGTTTPANELTDIRVLKTQNNGALATGISIDTDSGKGISIVPNPTQEQAVIYWDNQGQQMEELEILGVDGKLHRRKIVQDRHGLTLQRGSLSPGTYIVRLKGENGSFSTARIVITD